MEATWVASVWARLHSKPLTSVESEMENVISFVFVVQILPGTKPGMVAAFFFFFYQRCYK